MTITTKKILTIASLFSLFWGMAQVSPNELKYRRSSIYTVMIETPGLPYAEEIKKYFANCPMPDNFNVHILGKRECHKVEVPSGGYGYGAQQELVNSVERDMVVKWFNRPEVVDFNLDLVSERGSYDASAIDI